ncbi:MAG: HNH endonuclease [Firmicutes bacterium]|nr:HNH endonuclease [Bacillota bacterium]
MFNRDRGKCRICRNDLCSWYTEIHHISPLLPLGRVNKLNNLACVCKSCHNMIHNTKEYAKLGMKIWNKIRLFREKLKITINDNDGAPDEVKASRPV